MRPLRAPLLCLLIGSFWLAGCGEAVDRYQQVAAASGRVWKLIGVLQIDLQDGRPAVMLAYQTAFSIRDTAAVRAEAQAVLNDFVERVEELGTPRVVVSAQSPAFPSPEFGGWATLSDTRQFLLERDDDGNWELVSEKSLRILL